MRALRRAYNRHGRAIRTDFCRSVCRAKTLCILTVNARVIAATEAVPLPSTHNNTAPERTGPNIITFNAHCCCGACAAQTHKRMYITLNRSRAVAAMMHCTLCWRRTHAHFYDALCFSAFNTKPFSEVRMRSKHAHPVPWPRLSAGMLFMRQTNVRKSNCITTMR